MRVRPTAGVVLAAVSWLLAAAAPTASAGGWCDLVFKDVVDTAASVVVVEYVRPSKESPALTVTAVLKGGPVGERLAIDPRVPESFRLKRGDQLVMALTAYGQPVRAVRGMGGCDAVSILPIRGGKLRARERSDYDFGSKSITLEALQDELVALIELGP